MGLMSAIQARKNAEANKTHVDEVEHLKNHFIQLITKATNSGKFSIEKQKFAKDRFKDNVLNDVISDLKLSGYKVSEGADNAQQLVTFEISW